MDVKAYARHIHMAPRKIRLVTNLVAGLKVDRAITLLQFLPKIAAVPVRKVIESAVANAVHNAKLDRATLSIRSICADGGPTLKRSRPRAFGRSAPIRKRTTHISVVVTDEPVSLARRGSKHRKPTGRVRAKKPTPASTVTPTVNAAA